MKASDYKGSNDDKETITVLLNYLDSDGDYREEKPTVFSSIYYDAKTFKDLNKNSFVFDNNGETELLMSSRIGDFKYGFFHFRFNN